MKKLVYIALVIPVLLSFDKNEGSIIGKWTIDKYVEKITVSTGQVIGDTAKGSHADYFVFSANGKVYTHLYYSMTVDYDTENKKVFIGHSTEDRDYSSDTLDYKVSGTKLIFGKGGMYDTAFIQKLTDHELVMCSQTKDTLAPHVIAIEESCRFCSR